MNRRAQDLEPSPFPDIPWQPSGLAESLDELFRYVTGESERAITWYYRKRKPMQWGGRLLRLGAILSTGLAGLTPLLAEIFETEGRPGVDPLWAAVALTVAGVLILLDRFWGFTSAWVRYMVACHELTAALDAFRIDWARHKLRLAGGEPSAEQADAMILECRKFLSEVRAIVGSETRIWAREFQRVLEQVDAAIKSAARLGGPGAVGASGTRRIATAGPTQAAAPQPTARAHEPRSR
jgi:hypothetical protein